MRTMERRYEKPEEAATLILDEIESRRLRREPFIIAIDGRCAAGKTTLAALLTAALDCPVIHMDHFFLRPEQRTEERLREPGGNVDRERFLREVLVPLREEKACSYRPYDCHRQEFAEAVRIPPRPFYIVEGSYSCHPDLCKLYDLTVFLTVNPAEQLRRIKHRNGEAGAGMFQEKWIPLEERYFSTYSVEARCDLSFELEAICRWSPDNRR